MAFSTHFLTGVFYFTNSYKKIFRRITNFSVVSGLLLLFHTVGPYTQDFLGFTSLF